MRFHCGRCQILGRAEKHAVSLGWSSHTQKNLTSSIHAGIKQRQNNGTGVKLLLYGGYTAKLQLVMYGLVVIVGRIGSGRRTTVQFCCNGVCDVLDFLEFLLEVIGGG